MPDLTAPIQAETDRIGRYTEQLNRKWVELEGGDSNPPEDLLQAGCNLEQQTEENLRTYNHLESRFGVVNPASAPLLAIEAAPGERAQ